MAEFVGYEAVDDVATLTMDDGKANALSQDMSAALAVGLDRAEQDARVLVITGRPGILCGGFDLKVIRGDDDAARKRMRDAGFALLRRLYVHPQPVVIACTGHAVAAGGLLLLAADLRIGMRGDYKIGLNEVAIGLTLPPLGLELARERLSPRALTSATLAAQIFDPDGACAAGYLDETAEEGAFAAQVEAAVARLLEIDQSAFAATKRGLRQPMLDRTAD